MVSPLHRKKCLPNILSCDTVVLSRYGFLSYLQSNQSWAKGSILVFCVCLWYKGEGFVGKNFTSRLSLAIDQNHTPCFLHSLHSLHSFLCCMVSLRAKPADVHMQLQGGVCNQRPGPVAQVSENTVQWVQCRLAP